MGSSNNRSKTVKTSNNTSNSNNPQLNKVDIILSEKTGTLTKNSLQLTQCLIGDKIFGGIKDNKKTKPNFHINGDERAHEVLISDDYDYIESLEKNPQKAKLIEFLWVSSMCNEVFAEKDNLTGAVKYQSDRSRDFSLIEAAKEMGFVLNKRTPDTIEIYNELNNRTEVWEILYEIPFNSERRRDSIFVKNKDGLYGDSVFLLSKGNMGTMLQRMNITESTNSLVKDATDKFTQDGMRTLALGIKTLKYEEYSEWYSKVKSLINSENNEEQKDRELQQIHNEIETNLNFTAISAVQEALQEEVFDTIKALLKSGKKFWIVTGDRKEGTIKIAKECGLIDENTANEFIHITNSDKEGEIENKLDSVLNELKISGLNDFLKIKKTQTKKNYYLSIEGVSLRFLFEKESLFLKFLKVALVCRSVFFYRLTPLNKAEIVKMTKKLTKLVTLCIGEGSKDIPMMLEADFRASLKNEDGTELNQLEHYALEGFRNLKELLLVD